jgi:hypothetical protein
MQKEDRERKGVLFPVRIDDYLFEKWDHPRKADVVSKVVGSSTGTLACVHCLFLNTARRGGPTWWGCATTQETLLRASSTRSTARSLRLRVFS